MKNKLAILLLLISGSFGRVSAQKPVVMVSDKAGWHKIGETTVDFKKEMDEVIVLGADRFTALKFKVTDAPIDLQNLQVWFENDTKQDIELRNPIEVGKESRVVDLPGNQLEIRKIVFIYKTLEGRSDEKAHVEIYGLKGGMVTTDKKYDNNQKENIGDRERMEADTKKETNRSDNSVKEGVGIPKPTLEISDKAGWHRITHTIVSFKKERDEVAVLGANRYAKLKFKVTDAGIEITEMTLKYKDGTEKVVAVNSSFKEGQESRIIDLPGSEKVVTKIGFVYKSVPNQGKDKAHVEIWGLKTNAEKNVGENN